VISQASCTKYWPPFASWVQGGAEMDWVCSEGSNLAPVPLGLVAGDPDRHQDRHLCPSPVPAAAAGRGLRPRVFPAHRPPPQPQVQDSVMGRHPIVGIAYIQTGGGSFFKPFSQPTSCHVLACRFRPALRRKTGPRIALPAHRLYYPVDIWPRSTTRGFCGDLRDAP
jgi:hypothetical protein